MAAGLERKQPQTIWLIRCAGARKRSGTLFPYVVRLTVNLMILRAGTTRVQATMRKKTNSSLVAIAVLTAVTFWLSSTDCIACSPPQNWTPPTVEQQYRSAAVVVHLRILSQRASNSLTEATVKVIKVYKGQFNNDKIVTSPNGSCGLGTFSIGGEYVFFLGANENFVRIDSTGFDTTENVLLKLRAVQ